jgi:DNA-binding LacI/PurR family transcriptional regulator
MELFEVTRPTVARVLTALRNQGLVTVQGTRGVFVSEDFPHRTRYYWVTSEYPGHIQWTTFMATFLDLIERGETGLPGEVIPLVGVDGRANNPEYQRLCQVIEEESAAGLFVMNSATTYLLPILQERGLPRAAIWAPLPHSGLVTLAFDELIHRACQSVIQGGQRVAILSPHEQNIESAMGCLDKLGVPKGNAEPILVTPVGCESVTKLLMQRDNRPDAVFITDDNLIEPLLAGLKAAGVRPKRDVYVLAHCNWPRAIGFSEGVDHIGFDVREILWAGKECMDAQKAGDPLPARCVPARFLSELSESTASILTGE